MNQQEIAQTLTDAADVLLIHGRCRGVSTDGRGYCVRGAIGYVITGHAGCGFGLTGPVGEVSAALDVWLAAHPDVLDERSRVSHADWVERGSFPAWCWSDHTDDDEHVIDTVRLAAKQIANAA